MPIDPLHGLPEPVAQRWTTVASVWHHITRTLQISLAERIPTEKTLAEQLAIGRPKLREALVILEQLGLLERQRKTGTYRQKADPSYVIPYLTFYLNLDDHKRYRSSESLDMMRIARAAIEGAAAAEAAVCHTRGDILLMRAFILKQREAKGRLEEWKSEDCRFHQAVLAATHNAFLIELGRIIIDFFGSLNYPRCVCVDPIASKIISDHRRILEHIDRQEANSAQERMYRHVKFPRARKTRRL